MQGCKGLEAVEDSLAKELEEEDGEMNGDLAGMQPRVLDTSFSAVDSKEPSADDISVFQQYSQSPLVTPAQKGPRTVMRSYSKQMGTSTTTMNPEIHRVTWGSGSKMVKESVTEQRKEAYGKKGQDEKVNGKGQLCQLEIGELLKRASTHVPSLGQVEENNSNSESADSN